MSYDSTQHSPGQPFGGQRRKTWPRKAAASIRSAKKLWRHRSPNRDQDESSTISRLSSRIPKPSLPSDVQTATDLPIGNKLRAQRKPATREISSDTVEIIFSAQSEHPPPKEIPSTEKQSSAHPKSPASPRRPSSFTATDQGNGLGMLPPFRETSTTSSDRPNTTISEGAEIQLPSEQESAGQNDLNKSRITELERVLELRSDLSKLRPKIHRIWNDLREKQSQARSRVGLGIPYEDAQRSCNLLQDECEKLQNELTREESNLSERELRYERFYSQPGDFRRWVSSQETRPNPSSHSSSAHSISSSESDDDEQDHPLVAKLFAMQRDMDSRTELLNDFVEDRKALLRERDSQFQQEQIMDAKNQELLSGFEMQIDKLLEEMRVLGEELELLRQECLEKELIDEFGDPVE